MRLFMLLGGLCIGLVSCTMLQAVEFHYGFAGVPQFDPAENGQAKTFDVDVTLTTTENLHLLSESLRHER